jgi:glutathione S-transferase
MAVAKHLELPLEVETVDLRSGAHKQPAYLAINPNGKVPALVDGNRKLWESSAIVSYLASKKDTALWPKNDLRYDIMKWMSWESCHFAPAVSKVLGQVVFAPMRGAQPDQKIIDEGIADFRKYAAVANAQLETTKFLTGEQPTLADFIVGVWLGYEEVCKLPVSEYAHLARWWTAVKALPGGAELVPQG